MEPTSSESLRWAVVLPRVASAAIHAMRLMPDIEVGETGDTVWLRGQAGPAALDQHLKTLPTMARYVWLPDGRLRRRESRLVTEVLPSLDWQPLQAWARVVLPPVWLPAGLPGRTQLRLIAAHASEPSNALLLSFDAWFDWVIEAPAVRLAPLVFATRQDGRTLVLGSPVPSAVGVHLVEREGIVLPAGCTCAPPVSMSIIRRVFSAGERDVLHWDETGARLLNRELFVPANRASVRATRLALAAVASDVSHDD